MIFKKVLSISIILILSAGLILITSTSYATNSRIAALGGEELFIKDDVNIYRNPASIMEYPNFISLELQDMGKVDNRNPDNPIGGGIWKTDNDLFIGLFLNRDTEIANDINNFSDGDDNAYYSNPENPIDLFLAFKTNFPRSKNTSPVGLHIYQAHGLIIDEGNDEFRESKIISLDLGTIAGYREQ